MRRSNRSSSARALRIEREGWEQDAVLAVDPDLLEQAVHALLSNAVEASPAHARIRLEIARSGHAMELRIDDEGPGIAFEPDPRELSPGPSTKRGGYGLGIPVAWKICMRTEARSMFGAGTGAVRERPFSLPLAAPHPGT